LSLSGKHEYLWKAIGRIDAYIRSTNTKAAVVATFNTFILGTLGTLLQGIASGCKGLEMWSGISPWWLLISAVPAAFSLLFSAWAVFPYLQSGNGGEENSSLIFFQQIAERSSDTYIEEISDASPKKLEEDLSRQIYSVSRGADVKFYRLRVSIILLGIAGLSLLFLYPFYVT
jgi:hypothetical protein